MAKTKITLMHGDKGGVGKSTFCNLYADIKLAGGSDFVLVDCDTQNPDVTWTFEKIKKIDVHFINLKDHSGWMDLADLISAYQGKEIIISLPAGIGFHIQEEINFFAEVVRALDIELQMFFAIDRQKTSLLLFKKAMATFGDLMPAKNITVIKNGFFGAEEKFYRWEKSELKKAFDRDGGREVYIGELHERVVDAVERTPYSVALKNNTLAFSNQIELERWLKEATKVLTA